jgi:hypothetical protein
MGGCGLQSAGLCFGGWSGSADLSSSEEYDGTAWSAGGALGAIKEGVYGCGLQSAGLCFGGWAGSYKKTTEEYNGTAWSAGGDLNTARGYFGGCGSQTAALCFGGIPALASSEEYDGTAWSIGGTLNVGREWLPGCGTLGAGLSIGGWGTSYSTVVEEYNPPPPKFMSINNPLGFQEVTSLLGSLGETLEQLIVSPIAETEVKSIIFQLSSHIVGLSNIKNSLVSGDPFGSYLSLFSSIQSEGGSLQLQSSISSGITQIQSMLVELCNNITSGVFLRGEIALESDIQSLLTLVNSISDFSALYPDCSLSVYLDGRPINNKIISVSLNMDRGTVFDTVSINSVDVNFFLELQDVVGSSTSHIEVQYKSTSWFFLVEEVSNFEQSFSVWGRSIAAASSDTPFKTSTTFELDSDKLASVLAAELVPDLAVTWGVVDWTVMAGWTSTGTPIQLLQELAGSVGAVVRVYPDGTGVYIARKYPTRPVDLPYAATVGSFDRDIDLITISISRDVGTRDNAIEVFGYSITDRYSVVMEAENCTVVGNSVDIKIYPALRGVGYSLVSSIGTPAYHSSVSLRQTETVSFVGGKGSVRYPIVNIESIEWDGVVPLGFDFTTGNSEIVLTDDTVAALGEVIYYTSYDVWRLSRSTAGSVVIVCVPESTGDIVALVYFGDGDQEAESLDIPILTTVEAATEAGTAWLDDNSYTKLIRNIQVPCSAALDGEVIFIQSEDTGVEGNAHIQSHEISASRDGDVWKVYSNFNAVQFELS